MQESREESEENVAQCWDDNAETWSRHVRAGYDEYRILVNNPAFFGLVGDVQGRKILDAGCGEGYNTRLLADQGAFMTGIDLSTRMIDLAKMEEQKHPRGIRYETASFASLAVFENGEFDGIVSSMALMDGPFYDEAVREFGRLLRPGGFVVFSITHPCFARGDSEWIRDSSGQEIELRLTDYFKREMVEERWKFGAAAAGGDEAEPFRVCYFNRTLEDYINPLCKTGFILEAIVEPRPGDEACRIRPSLRKHQRIPHTLMLRAKMADLGRRP